jgi:hypothetical protein
MFRDGKVVEPVKQQISTYNSKINYQEMLKKINFFTINNLSKKRYVQYAKEIKQLATVNL